MDFDLFVIGGGSGGVRAARISASLGARVALAEAGRLGGTCVNVGCVPKKLFSIGAHFPEEVEDARAYGWTTEAPRRDWATLIRFKDKEIARLNGIYARILEGSGTQIVRGFARIVDAHTVEVEGARYTAEHILVATGGQAYLPAVPGIEHVITSDECFTLPDLPPRIAIVGGGYIGCEFASVFNGYGAHVDLLFRSYEPLKGFDSHVRGHVAEQMAKKGVKVRPHSTVAAIRSNGEGYTLELADPHDPQAHPDTRVPLHTDLVLYATGRVPNTSGLGLDAVGIETDRRGAIVVDQGFQTSVPSIYAVGDVSSKHALTPVALEEGMNLAQRLFGGSDQLLDLDLIPTAVFCHPNVGTVGVTEEAARARGHDVVVYCSRFRPMKHTLTGRDEHTLMKLVVDADTDMVLGVHIVGPEAGEIVQGFAVALTCGATKAQFDQTLGIHPTAAEELVTMRTPA